MKNEEYEEKICPNCGQAYTARPALSRKDNKTLICPDCGIREVLSDLGIDFEEQEKILEAIHGSYGLI